MWQSPKALLLDQSRENSSEAVTGGTIVSHIGLTNIQPAEAGNYGDIRNHMDGILAIGNLIAFLANGLIQPQAGSALCAEINGNISRGRLVLK